MRLVNIEDLEPGFKLARNIYNADGRILLNAGVILTPTYIKRLNDLGVNAIYIKDIFSQQTEDYPDIISEHSRVETMTVLKKTFYNLKNDRKLNTRIIQSTVNNLIDELLYNSYVLISLKDIHLFDDYTFAHSLNVCLLSLVTGITLGYDIKSLEKIGVGALLHDIGKTKISKTILNKPDNLTVEEYAKMKKHAELGFQILRQYPEISLLSAHIAYQHHERLDGSGYPRNLTKDEIHDFAKIVAVADVYDSLMSDRPYRPSYTFNQSLSILKSMAGHHLDPQIIEALASNIAVYPIGTLVELNTGSIGIVTDINKGYPTHPVVNIILEQENKALTYQKIDLSTQTSLRIVSEISTSAFKKLFNKKLI